MKKEERIAQSWTGFDIFDFKYVLNFDKRNTFISCIDKLEIRTFCTSSDERLYRIPNNIILLKKFGKIVSIFDKQIKKRKKNIKLSSISFYTMIFFSAFRKPGGQNKSTQEMN